MRYILFMFMILVCSRNVNAQLNDNQIRVRPSQEPDSILVMSNDTNSSSIYYKTGKWRKLSDLIGSVAGDTDWYKVGGTAIPTNSDSAYRSGYTLFTGLYGGLATKIEMLKEGTLRFNHADGHSARTWMRVRPLQTTEDNPDFIFNVETASTSGDQNNDVLTMGWNLLSGATRENSSLHAMGLSFENNYITGGDTLIEFHYRLVDLLGADRRIFSYITTLGHPYDWYGYNTLSKFYWLNPYDNGAFCRIGTDTDYSSYIRLLGSGGSDGIEMLADASANNFQITPFGMVGATTLYCDGFDYSEFDGIRRGVSVNTPTKLIGADGSGWIGDVTTGWGLTFSSGELKADTSKLATQYDLTTIADTDDQGLTLTGTGPYTIDIDNGSDIIVDDLFGIVLSEPTANTLGIKADTSVLATPYDITQIPINYIKAATATNTAAHANYGQEWSWNSLNGSGLKLSSTSTASSSTNHKLFEISTTGVNGSSGATTYGAYLSNTHSGTTSTNYGLYALATGAATANYGVYGTSNSTSVLGNAGAGVSGRNSNGGIAVEGITTSGGVGVYAESPDGYSLYTYTTNGTAGAMRNNWSSNNDYGSILDLYRTTSSGSNGATGIGGGIAFWLETSTGAVPISNQLKSVWTTATNASRVSDFIITGVNAATEADLLTVKGSGKTVLNKYGVGSFTSGTPTYNIVVDASGNLMEAAVPVGGLNVVEENNVVVQSANVNIDFQNPFDVATDGSSEVNVSLDCGEFTTVTGIESDDYMLMHDSGVPQNQKILWSDVLIDLISFKDGNSSVGTGNAIDVGEGLDIIMSPSTEANINLDASEFQIDGGADGTEYVLIHDIDTTAGHQIQRRLVSSFSGGTDKNFAEDDLTFDANRSHDMDIYSLTLHGDAANVYIQDDNGGTGNSLVLVSEYGASNGIVGGISFQSENGGTPTELFDIEGEKVSSTQSILRLSGEQSTDSEIIYEKNSGLSANTTASHLAINGGIAFTQNYEWTATGADLTLDRSFNIVNVSGSGAIGDEINLPEVNSTNDNWDSGLSSAQVQVGQTYTISNFRASTNLVVRVFTGDEINGAGVTTVTLLPTTSLIVKCVRFNAGVGYWKTY